MRLLLFIACVCYASATYSQEDPSLTAKLKDKYGYVYYSEMGDDDKCYIVGNVGKQGACDLYGNEIVPPKYDYAVRLGGVYLSRLGELYGVYNLQGKEITPPKWTAAVATETGYVQVFDGEIGQQGTKQGLYSFDGDIIFPCIYDRIDGLSSWDSEGFLLPMKNGYFGMTNNKGDFILQCEYSKIEIIDTLGVVLLAKGGEINKRGSLYPPINAKWGIVTMQGKQIVPNNYDYIGGYGEGLFVCNKGGRINDNNEPEGGYFGYLDIKGNIVIPCKYEEASKFEDGIAQVKHKGTSSLLTNPLTGTKMIIANDGTENTVDVNIPKTDKNAENTFAFIFANENYSNFSGADFSINDGKVFKEYCNKTLGVPEKNIRYYEDATYGNLTGAIKKIQDITDVYEGDAKIIVYYSGLGTTDKDNVSYILPTDASINSLSTTGYKLQTFMDIINALNTEMTLVILDAPFSGKGKDGNMLTQNRGVAIKAKTMTASGNSILCISNQHEETARSDKKYGHSLYTYALLEKLQSSKGDCTIKEAIDYVGQWVKRESMNSYDSTQTPQVVVSETNRMWNSIKW